MAHEYHRVIHFSYAFDEEDPDLEHGTITYIGNATLLIEFGEIRILTDPAFIRQGEEVGLGYGVLATRLTNPAMTIADLPPLEAILLSHFHGDHFDRAAIQHLDRRIPVITTPASVDDLERRDFENVHPLSTWQAISLRKGDASVTITAMPACHGPAAAGIAMPEVMGSMLEFRSRADAEPYRVYISGDTLSIDRLREIPQRYPRIDLAVLHLGGAQIHGVTVTMDARQGLEVFETIAPNYLMPIHYNDFDVFKSPLEEFQDLVCRYALRDRVTYVDHGDTYMFRVPCHVRRPEPLARSMVLAVPAEELSGVLAG
jgi:L-ascorbate metabolism protein UlaG (beta-lactamase superfamily)